MKLPLVFLAVSLLVSACGREDAKKPAPLPVETPILPVSPGDRWIYQVVMDIPEGVTSPGAAAVSTAFQRTRTYLGKISAAEGLPASDCFEVAVPGSATEREFVEILEDRILLLGSLIMRPETTRPMWLAPPVPFVVAGMKAGTALPEVRANAGGLIRKTRVIAREEIAVPAGSFPCIRLLTTGSDGELEMRRTTWFSPGNGIIREETARYRRDKLIYREIQELVSRNGG